MFAGIAVGVAAVACAVLWFAVPARCKNCGHPSESHVIGRVPCCDVDDCGCPRPWGS